MRTKLGTRDLAGLDRDGLIRMYRTMLLARSIETAEQRLRRQQSVFFQISGAGHEAFQVATAALLRPGYDWFYPYYRDRALCLALGVSPRDMILQAMGKAEDPSSGGREMPCHFGSPALHIVNQSSPTGTQYLQAVGTADGKRIAHSESQRNGAGRLGVHGVNGRGSLRLPGYHADELVYVSGGEGSTSEGEFYEALSIATLKRLPVLFAIQDNGYAISTPVEAQTPGANIARVVSGFPNLLVEEVDGLDPLASFRAMRRIVAHVRAGNGPAVVRAHVVRLSPHSDSDDDSAYRAENERETERARDPLPHFEAFLLDEELVDRDDVQRLQAEADELIDAAVSEAAGCSDPDPGDVTRFVVSPVSVVERETSPSDEGEPLTMVDAINRTLAVEMERDPRVLIFGEDVADLTRTRHFGELRGKGGVFKVTSGLQRRFGSNRVFNTPIAEAGIVGRALGLAVRGWIPVVEIQFQDYIWPAMHQIRNELSMLRWRSNNTFSAPLVIRVPIGGYLTGGGPYHSQCGESIFCHCPGLKVVLPSNAADAAGLLRAAIRCGDPVIFFEHKHLYRQTYSKRPDPGPDYVLPFGRAAVAREGRDVTIITFGALVQRSLRAADRLEEEGIDAEVIDLRSLEPYDWETISRSVQRTNRVVVAYEDNRRHGYGAEIAARVADELFVHLDAPVRRVASLDAPISYSPILEQATLPQVEDVVNTTRDLLRF